MLSACDVKILVNSKMPASLDKSHIPAVDRAQSVSSSNEPKQWSRDSDLKMSNRSEIWQASRGSNASKPPVKFKVNMKM